MNYTGKQFVQAIIAVLREKGRTSISFHKRDFDINLTKNKMPWCVYFDEFIDTVSISSGTDNIGKICVCVCTDGGQILWEHFDGSENEDFDGLFNWVYNSLWDGGIEDEEADIWLEEFFNPTKPLAKRIDQAVAGAKACLTELAENLIIEHINETEGKEKGISLTSVPYIRLDKYDMVADETIPAAFKPIKVFLMDRRPAIRYIEEEAGRQFQHNDFLRDLSLSDIQSVLYAIEKVMKNK